jgi:antitoxin (DNA-binding transcriptional repressor) of toxin-antitoxin stability system
MMHHISSTEARNHWSTTVSRVAYGNDRLMIRRNSDEVAMIPAEDLHLLERLQREEEDRIDAAEARRVRNDSDEVRIPWEKVKEDLGL